jgi:hypothetical protein
MTDLREKIARIIAAERITDDFPDGFTVDASLGGDGQNFFWMESLLSADAILTLVRAELASDAAVERAVDAIGGRGWSCDIRAAILGALGEEPTP